MRGRKENSLIVIENGQLRTYTLDNKLCWEIGRPTKENNPDIKLRVPTISRKHGKFQNIDGNWFYMDHKSKNGTVYNDSPIKPGIKGRVRPVALSSGDILIFGGKEEAIIDSKTVWALYLTEGFDGEWQVEDTKGIDKLIFVSGEDMTRLNKPDKGTVVDKDGGIAIYMGDKTYLYGQIEVIKG